MIVVMLFCMIILLSKRQGNLQNRDAQKDFLNLNKIFNISYGNVRAKLKAVLDRGWYPANRKLEQHPSLIWESLSSQMVQKRQGRRGSKMERMLLETSGWQRGSLQEFW